MERFFFQFFFSFEKVSWIGVVPTNCACSQSSVFAEAMDFGSSCSTSSTIIEQKGQDGLACDEEPWCLSGSDSSDGRKIRSRARQRVQGQRTPPPPPCRLRRRSTSASFLPCGETCWRLVTGTKMTPVLFMCCLPRLSYVDSACNLWDFCVYLVWDVFVEDPERRWHGGTGGLHGTTMSVPTFPELFTYSVESE